MKSYIVFLRGINVNGIKIKMAELRAVFESLGYKEVKTILASGNVSFKTDEDHTENELKGNIEAALKRVFNYEAFIVLMKKSALLDIFIETETMSIQSNYNHYLLLSNEPAIGKELEDFFGRCSHSEGEALIVSDKAIQWIVKKGDTLKTEFGKKILGSKRYKSILTSRNIGTLKKIASL